MTPWRTFGSDPLDGFDADILESVVNSEVRSVGYILDKIGQKCSINSIADEINTDPNRQKVITNVERGSGSSTN